MRIAYRYGFSVLIDKLLPLLSAVLAADQGKYQVSWTSPSFFAHWDLSWNERQMTIQAEWLRVVGQYEAFLNHYPTVQTSKDTFLREWKGLLRKLIEAIHLTGIEIEAQEELNTLERVYAAICSFGVLYQPQERAAFLPNVELSSSSSSASLSQDLNGSLPHVPEELASSAVLGQLAAV